jgi:glutamate dehydrogenase (NAD(P)+)
VLTGENAERIKAPIIVEAANAPTNLEADDIFARRGLVVVPDILANSGGVTASYFEWAQNRQHYQWELNRVRQELDRTMIEAFERVWEISHERKVSLRTAAYILGIGRVSRATNLAGAV